MLWKKLLGSTIVRIWIAVVSFTSLLLTARFLGAEGRGEISLLVANLAMLQLIIDIANGPAIIYLVPKIPVRALFNAGMMWLFLICGLSFGVLIVLFKSIIPIVDLINLAFLFSFSNLIQLIFQGQNRILAYNLSIFLQQAVLLSSLLVHFFILEQQTPHAFVISLYLGYGAGILSMFFLLKSFIRDTSPMSASDALKQMLHDGAKAQLSNILNFFNGRLSYYIIVGIFFDEKALGKYATAVALSEAVWIISYSLAAVQYPALTRTTPEESVKLTCGLSKITFYLSTTAIIVLCLIPSEWYTAILGKDFNETRWFLLLLGPGVIWIAVHKIYWNYFAANGKFHTNNWSNGVSLLMQVPLLFLLLHLMGLEGAAISASIAGVGAMLSLLFAFRKSSKVSWKEILPGKSDWEQIQYVWHFRHS